MCFYVARSMTAINYLDLPTHRHRRSKVCMVYNVPTTAIDNIFSEPSGHVHMAKSLHDSTESKKEVFA
jgi:hypothetical protein